MWTRSLNRALLLSVKGNLIQKGGDVGKGVSKSQKKIKSRI